MNWTATSALTALGVTVFVALAAWYPEYYKAWGLIGLFGVVFALMLLRNPAYRYMRLAWWITAAWVAAAAVPEIKARIQVSDQTFADITFGNQPGLGFHAAFAVAVLGCLLLDYFSSREKGALFLLIDRLHIRFGGQRQHVTGGTGIQIGDVGDHATVNIHQTDLNRELDHARELLNKGKPDAAEEQLNRIRRDHEMTLSPQQRYKLQAYLGQVFHDRGDAVKAATHFANARDLRPDDEQGQAHGVLAEFMAGKNDSAYRQSVELLQRHPASALATAVMVRSAPPDLKAAELAAKVNEAVKDEIDVLSALALRYLSEQDPKTSEAYARRALAKRPDHPSILGAVATAVVNGEAMAAARRLGEGGPEEEARKRLEEAVKFLTDAMNSSRSAGEVRQFKSSRGLARELLGQFPEAEADHIAAVESDRSCAQSAARYASYLYRKKRYAEGLSVLRPPLRNEAAPELAFLFGVMALEGGERGDKQEAVSFIRAVKPRHPGQPAMGQEETVRVLAFLTHETAGLEPALAVLKERFGDEAPVVRSTVEAELQLKAGDRAAADVAATTALDQLTELSDVDHRLQVAQVLGRLQRFPDVVRVLRSFATAENYELAGRRALAAASHCGADDFVLSYTEQLRQAGRWDAYVVELEVETRRRYRDFDGAVKVCREFIERSQDETERRLARLRLSLIGLESGQRSLVEVDPEKLPRITDVDPHIGRLLCGVLEVGAGVRPAIDAAYELVRRHFLSHEAHIALCMAVGIGRSKTTDFPEPDVAAAGTAVRIRLDREPVSRWVVIEDGPNPDPTRNEFSPDHPRAQELLGKKVGDRFTDRSNRFQERGGVVEEVRSKHRYRAWESIAHWHELFRDVPFVFRFDLERPEGERPDFGPIIKAIEEQEQTEEHVTSWYREHPVSILMLAVASHRHPTEVIQHLANHPDLPIRCCQGMLEEFEAGSRDTGAAAFVADPSALATLFVTNLWRQIPKVPFRLVVCRSALDEYHRLAEELRNSSDERLARSGNELVRVLIPPEHRQQLIQAHEEFVEWVRSVAEIRSGVALARLPQPQREQLITLYGQTAAESAAWAIQDRLPIWTDDYTVPIVMSSLQPAQRTWTQLVAGRLRAEGSITEDAFANLLAQLIASGYEHTQCSPDAMVHAARLSHWDPERRPFRDTLRWLENERINDDGILGVTVNTLRLVWRNAPLYHQREGATLGIGRAIATRPDGRILVRGIAAHTSRLFPLEPSTAAQCRDVLLRSLEEEGGTETPRIVHG